ncbi:hypothetical protein GCM10017559_08170 [Streptosporangium longisporum]|uniref:Uncharacterized protein n=1 Tax=Streptosporangium longisporum TaxID=46187 RepID=A0ABP6KB67_9ACTN
MAEPTLPDAAVRAAADVLRRRDFDDTTFDGYARAVLEAAAPVIAERIAAEIERVVASGDHPRPRYERGGFLNDAHWAAQVARDTYPKET